MCDASARLKYSTLTSSVARHLRVYNEVASKRRLLLIYQIRMILKSPHPDCVVPDNLSLPAFMLQQLEKHADNIAMISPRENKSYRYADLINLTHRFARGLFYGLGVKKGDVVATCLANSCEFLPLALAIGLLGATVNTSNPGHTVQELVDQFQKCSVRLLVTMSDLLEKANDVRKQCPAIEGILLMDATADGCFYISDLSAKYSNSPISYPTINAEEDVMFLMSSSGTSGLPKAVMLTHYAMVANVCQTCPQFSSTSPDPQMFTYFEDDVILSTYPHFHVSGISNAMLCPLTCGGTLIIFPRYDPAEFVAAIRTYKVTAINVPPPILIYLAKSPNVSEADCRSVTKVFFGAAPVSKELSEEVFAKVKPKRIIQGYGMTEMSPCILIAPWNSLSQTKHGSAGVLVSMTECKVVDIETGRELEQMQTGELCFRGPQMMKGYLNNPDATKASTDKDGWLHSGDVGYYDADGYFYIVDRIKELIKVKGFQVAPAELEGILLSHPAVADAGVFGIPDEYKGEIPRAHVILKIGAKTNEKEIKRYLAGRVASYKRLEGGVKFVTDLPKSPSGKILRRLLRDQARSETARKVEQLAAKL